MANFIIVKYRGGIMSAHEKNMTDNRTTANLKDVFITANWKRLKASVRSGWARLLQSGDT